MNERHDLMKKNNMEKDTSIQRRVISLILSLLTIYRIFWKRKLPAKPEKILVIQWAYLGDMVMSTPAIKALRDAFPKSDIHLLTNPENESYIRGCPFVNKFIFLENPLQLGRRNLVLSDIFRCISRLREDKYDLAIELTGRLTSQFFLLFLRAGYLVGQDPTGNAYFLDRRVASGRKYELDRDMDIMKECMPREFHSPSGDVWSPVTVSDRDAARKILKDSRIDEYVMIHPIGSWSPRQWPLERWAKVADHISASGKHVIFIGAPDDRGRVDEIVHVMKEGKVLNLAGLASIRQVMALMEKAKSFVGIDSGPAHLAFAAKLKGVVLFSSGDPLKWAHPIHTIIYKNPECGPCAQFAFSKVCRKGYGICKALDEISVEEVMTACEKYL